MKVVTDNNPFAAASWIWNKNINEGINQYVEFRHAFALSELPSFATLFVSVDSDCVVWLNGTVLHHGQYGDFPKRKAYDRITGAERLLRQGDNVLCIQAYYKGESSSRYFKGRPGLIYRLAMHGKEVISGPETFCRPSPCYTSGRLPHITGQLGFTFEYDACLEDNWKDTDYVTTGEWIRATSRNSPEDIDLVFYERPIRMTELKERRQATVYSQGLFIRDDQAHYRTVAELMQSDYLAYRMPNRIFSNAPETMNLRLPLESGLRFEVPCSSHELESSIFFDSTTVKGVYLVLDLGREESGLLEFELEGEEGTTIDIAYGEHLDDLRVRAEVGGRNFASRVRCGKGRKTFTHYFTRFAGRFIQLHISGVKESFTLYYAGLRPVEYPVVEQGKLVIPDRLHGRVADTAVRTLHLCMHEHYEDTPWREQALYAMDSRNQALCGYYSFGEYDFPQASFQLLGESMREDGYLELCAPAEVPITIPCFSLIWIVELEEHLLYSGREEFIKSLLPVVKQMLDKRISEMNHNLLPVPKESKYWNFYEWEDGLEGASNRSGYERVDAPLNLFFIMALNAASFMLNECGMEQEAQHYSTVARRIGEAVHRVFWNNAKQAYITYHGVGQAEHYAELTQALALIANVCPAPLASDLRARLAMSDNGLVPITISHSIFKYKALLEEPDTFGQFVFDTIAETWGGMLFQGATSFWETNDGANAFGRAGSLCHGWSATPLYFYYSYLLGVRPLEPGFRAFRVAPVPGGFHQASGVVPTPRGPIEVSWKNTETGVHIKVAHPSGTVRCP